MILCVCKSLFGGFSIPFNSLDCILLYAVTIFITLAQIILRVCVSLFSGFPIPCNGLDCILLYAVSIPIAHA